MSARSFSSHSENIFTQRLILGFWVGTVILFAVVWGSGASDGLVENSIIQPRVSDVAAYWKPVCHGVQCGLCPKRCFLPEGERGWCRVRVNTANRLLTQVYGLPAAIHIDPIEKKPVFHLLPGSQAFSLATAGCNLGCDFCQNWSLSASNPEQLPADFIAPAEIVELAKQNGCRSIAFTYSEPVVFYEYMKAIAVLAHKEGLYNVMITGGYIEERPLRDILPYMDVIKVDLKGFDDGFYRKVVKGELQYVRRTLKIIAKSKVQLEVVNLLLPHYNDDETKIRQLCRWIAKDLGEDTPIFFSRFSPQYRMQNVLPTPLSTMRRARQIAQETGLNYVYLGNVLDADAENTICPVCHKVLIDRQGYVILENNMLDRTTCPNCGTTIPGIWTDKKKALLATLEPDKGTQ